MTAESVMTSDPVSVDATATLAEAARKLAEGTFRHLPVLRDGAVVGILSDRDMRSVLPSLDTLVDEPQKFREALATPVTDVMTSEVDSVQPDDDLRDVVDLMLAKKVGAIVVVRPGSSKLVGIISYIDVLRVMRGAIWD